MPRFKTKPREAQARICNAKEQVYSKNTMPDGMVAEPGDIIVKEDGGETVCKASYFWRDFMPAEAKAKQMKAYWDEHHGPNRARQGAREAAKAQEQDLKTDPE